MKKILIVFIILVNSLLFAVNGELTVEEDRMILKVWGTHAERGEAQGFLLSENILDLFNNYALAYTFSNNVYVYNQAIQLVENSFDFEAKYIQEMEGILAGMEESGADLYNETLDREFGLSDLKLVNSIIDIAAFLSRSDSFQGDFGCSSLANWGSSTLEDPQLNGDIVISRLLDWTTHPSLIANSLMIIHEPSEEDEQNWLSFTYPGLIGGLTGLNEAGVFTELNMGNISGSTTAPYSPILLDTRTGLEQIDYNNDYVSNADDIYDSVADKQHCNGFIIMIANPVVDENPVSYIEVNASGIERRTITDNSELQGNNIASTNHFRKLADPIYCYRYENLVEATVENTRFTIERNFSTIASGCGHPGTMMAIQYLPSLDTIKWSTYHDLPAHLETLVPYDISELFESNIVDISEDHIPSTDLNLHNYPNPFEISGTSRNAYTTISFDITKRKTMNTELAIYNCKGQRVKTLVNEQLASGTHTYTWNGTNESNQPVSSGIYFYKLENEDFTQTKKMLLLK